MNILCKLRGHKWITPFYSHTITHESNTEKLCTRCHKDIHYEVET